MSPGKFPRLSQSANRTLWIIVSVVLFSVIRSANGSYYDLSLTIVSQWGHLTDASDSTFIQCLSDRHPPESLRFHRVLNTGQDLHLPSNKVETVHHGQQPNLQLQLAPSSDDKDRRFGAFSCQVTSHNVTTEVVTLKQAAPEKAEVISKTTYLRANAGEDVVLQMDRGMASANLKPGLKLLWRHRGKQIQGTDHLQLFRQKVNPSHSGIYELFFEGRRKFGVHGILRLNVRECPEGMYGSQCEHQCQPCYNSGVCHDRTGNCICAPGFVGPHCQSACDFNKFGPKCNWECEINQGNGGRGCSGFVICLPDPFGCSCATGFMGPHCTEVCSAGKFGANCLEDCHCTGSVNDCDPMSGRCAQGCQDGWIGANCQEPKLLAVEELRWNRKQRARDQVRVSWKAPANTHSGNLTYVILARLRQQEACGRTLGNTDQARLQTAAKEVTLSGLLPFSIYEVIVYANSSQLVGDQLIVNITTEPGEPTGRPENVSTTSTGVQDLKFSWKGVACGDANGIIISYSCELWPLSSSSPTADAIFDPWAVLGDLTGQQNSDIATAMDVADASAEFTDLKPYHHYAFRVRANTEAGAGPWSTWVMALTEHNIPPSPQLLKLEATARTLTVGISIPGLPPGIVQKVHLQGWPGTVNNLDANITSNAAPLQADFDVTTDYLIHNYTFTRLQPFTPYVIQGQTYTRSGRSYWGPFLSVRTEETYPPAPSVAVLRSDADSLSLQVTRPQPSNGVILAYMFRIAGPRASGSTPSMPIVSVPDDVLVLNYTVRDLKPLTGYHVEVQASVSVGWGNWSQRIEVWTDEGLPDPPSSLSLMGSNETALRIHWTAPALKNGRVLGYEILCIPQSSIDPDVDIKDLNNVSIKVDSDTRTLLLEGLEPLTRYLVSIRACTKQGYGEMISRVLITAMRSPPPLECFPNSATETAIPVRIPSIKISSQAISYFQIVVEDSENEKPIEEERLAEYETSVDRGLGYYIGAEVDGSMVPTLGLVLYVGDGRHYGYYWNAPLHREKTYRLALRMILFDGERNHTAMSQKTTEILKVGAMHAAQEAENECRFYDPQCIWFPFVVVGTAVLLVWIIASIVIYKCWSRRAVRNQKMVPCEKDRGSSSSIGWSVTYRKGNGISHSEASTLVKDHSSV